MRRVTDDDEQAAARALLRLRFATWPSETTSQPTRRRCTFAAGDVVEVVGCVEGQAKLYEGQRGRVLSRQGQSPWFAVLFANGASVPVRSKCLQHAAPVEGGVGAAQPEVAAGCVDVNHDLRLRDRSARVV